jgi:hypothetical protein
LIDKETLAGNDTALIFGPSEDTHVSDHLGDAVHNFCVAVSTDVTTTVPDAQVKSNHSITSTGSSPLPLIYLSQAGVQIFSRGKAARPLDASVKPKEDTEFSSDLHKLPQVEAFSSETDLHNMPQAEATDSSALLNGFHDSNSLSSPSLDHTTTMDDTHATSSNPSAKPFGTRTGSAKTTAMTLSIESSTMNEPECSGLGVNGILYTCI